MREPRQEATSIDPSGGGVQDVSEKYLTFRLGKEEYGLEILKVREIIGLMNITRVPRAPIDVRGVINLRGKIIPVVDLRSRFRMAATEDTDRSCIIVVDVTADAESVDMGVLVDSVSEVLDIPDHHVGPAPSFGNDVNTDFILGMAKTGERVIILLAIERVLSSDDLQLTLDAQTPPSAALAAV